jgi:ABC-type nitrate/sulfonate/bicarbonate transport system permease component
VSVEERVAGLEVAPSEPAEVSNQARTRTRRLTGGERARKTIAPRLRLYQVAVLLGVLGLWEWFGRRSASFTFAAPSEIAVAAKEMMQSGELQSAIGDSLVALLIGFALAVGVGTVVGYALGWWRMLGRTLDPFVAALYVVPIAALVPVLIVWFGFGLETKVIVIFLFAVFEPLIAAQAAIAGVDRAYIDVARTLGAGTRQLARQVVFPATLPFVFPAARMAASRAVKGMVLAEMLVVVGGLGGLVIQNARSFRMDKVFVAIIAIAVIGVVLTSVLHAVERYVLRWRG